MESSLDLNDIRELSMEIKERVSLANKPIGISIIGDETEIPNRAKRPSERGMVWPVCLAANQVRTMGWTVALTLEDHFCAFAAAGLGFIELPEYLKDGEMGRHHTRTRELGVKIQEGFQKRCFFPPWTTRAVVLTPMTDPMFIPQGMIVYGSPSQIGKLSKAITWFKGEAVPVSAGGFGGCVMASAAIIEGKSAIVLPCSGEKIWGHTEENDIFLASPLKDLPRIVEGLKGTDTILPYPTAKYLMFEPKATKSYPIDMKYYKDRFKKRST